VVDDEAEIAHMLAGMLEIDGHACAVAVGGRAALARLQRERFDLVLSDLRMPDLDGPGLYRALARGALHEPRRVGFVTGDTFAASASRFIAETGAAVLEKPFTAPELRGFVARLAREPADLIPLTGS